MEHNDLTHSTSITNSPEEDQDESVVFSEVTKTEVNFSALPFFALSNRDASNRSKLEYRITVERDGQAIEALWKVLANIEYGFPTPFDRRVHKAIEHIVMDNGLPVENPIVFSIYQILKLLNLSKRGGANYRKVRETIRRIVHTGIDSQGAFYSKSEKRYVSDSFHLYDRVVFRGSELPDGTIAERNYLFLSDWYMSSINSFYVRPIDFHYLRTLNSAIASRLYELIGLRFYGVLMNNRPYCRIGYDQLCDLLPIVHQRYLSKAKEKLQPAHTELTATGFLSLAEWETGDGKDWYVKYYPGWRAIEEFRQSQGELESVEQLSLPLQSMALSQLEEGSEDSIQSSEIQRLAQMLIERGVSEGNAKFLARRYSDRIELQTEVFDWLMKTDSPKMKDNPPGFLRKSIEEDWAPPANFVSRADGERREKQLEQKRRKREEADARRAAEAQKVTEERKRRMGESPYRDVWERVKEQLRGKMVSQSFSSWIAPLYISSIEDDKVVIDCPTVFLVDWLEENYRGLLEGAVGEVQGREMGMDIVCSEGSEQSKGRRGEAVRPGLGRD